MASPPPPPGEAAGSYATALTRLAQLQSNRAITSLFDPPTTSTTTTTGPATPGKPIDINALAIPEMLAWLSRAGLPPATLAASPLRCVHVAGTKGKGSVSALVAGVVGQYASPPPPSSSSGVGGGGGGGRGGGVGLYTSPHVLSVRERIVLNGAPIPREKLGREVVTAAVVTQLGIDHVSMLGDTVEKIAWHKSGVFKEGVKAFTRRLPEEQAAVMEVLRARAREKGAVLVEVTDEEVERWGGVEGARLQGPFQKYNMALAVYAAREHLLQTGVKFEGCFGTDEWSLNDIPPEFVKGLKEAALRGRCEVFKGEDGIEWHVDGAHTDDSLAGVGRWFGGRTGGDEVRILVFNQQERDPAPLLRALLAGVKGTTTFTHAIFTRNEEQKPEGEDRDLSTQTRAQETMREFDSTTETTVRNAVEPTIEQVKSIAAQARKDGKACKVLVTGSFHLVGAVLKLIDHVEY
ncbi:Mur ligase [Chaetomium tenue]|uniref:Mur ligase n=1 Tax=Chaetomium tenue TaxID=1854479 RepID=A0ACB7PPS8_9PEZI|nr:Mur ligase [Chaetomium globosum]